MAWFVIRRRRARAAPSTEYMSNQRVSEAGQPTSYPLTQRLYVSLHSITIHLPPATMKREFQLTLSSVLHRTLRIQRRTQATCTCQRAKNAPIPLATYRQTTADMPVCQRSEQVRDLSYSSLFSSLFGQGRRFLMIGR